MAAHDYTTIGQLDLFSTIETEVWRPVVSWEGFYEVSNFGQVRSLERPVACKSGFMRMVKGHTLIQQRYGRGKKWHRVSLWDKQEGTPRPVHQLVLEAFVGPRPEGHVTNHKDGNPDNNHVSNLEWCTVTYNNVHALDTGLRNIRGEDHYAHRFTVADVREMRRLRKEGMGPSAIARHFQASLHTVRKIVEYKTWKHVPED